MNKYQMVFNAIITIAVLYTMFYVSQMEDKVVHWVEFFERVING